MAHLNKVMLIGNIGQDPEIRQAGESQVANFRIACTERWVQQDGQAKERTEWITIVAWRGLANITQQYLKKGMQIFVEGKMQTRSWEDQNGAKRYATEVVASNIQMLGKKQQSDDSGQHDGSGYARGQRRHPLTRSSSEPGGTDVDGCLPTGRDHSARSR